MSRQLAFKDKEFSTESCEHYTPPWLIEIVRDIMGGIDLDPCSSEKASLIVRASKFYTEEQDGLSVNSSWGWSHLHQPSLRQAQRACHRVLAATQ